MNYADGMISMSIYWPFYTLLFIIIMLVAFILTKRQIINRIKLLVRKKKGYGLIIELRSNRTKNEKIMKIEDKVELDGRTYAIDPTHIFIDTFYGASAVVVSENIGGSINPLSAEVKEYTPKTIDKLIKRAQAEGATDIIKWLKYVAIAVCFMALILLLVVLLTLKNQAALGQLLTAPARI